MNAINTSAARQWLSRARKIDKEINQDLELIQHTREKLTNVTQALDAVTVTGTKDPHKYDRLVELEDSVNAKVDELVATKAEIFNVLSGLPNRNQRLALTAYYLDMKTWEQIAVDMFYSYDNVMRIRKLGLIEVEMMLRHQKNT